MWSKCSTACLQPMDLDINKSVKNFLCKQFQIWYSKQVEKNLRGKVNKAIDTRMSTMKLLGGSWLEELHKYLLQNKA